MVHFNTDEIEKLIAAMTLAEKISVRHGCDSLNAGGVKRLCIGRMTMADGPQGVRLEDGRTPACSRRRQESAPLRGRSLDVEVAQLLRIARIVLGREPGEVKSPQERRVGPTMETIRSRRRCGDGGGDGRIRERPGHRPQRQVGRDGKEESRRAFPVPGAGRGARIRQSTQGASLCVRNELWTGC
jgi:hypothetical protein